MIVNDELPKVRRTIGLGFLLCVLISFGLSLALGSFFMRSELRKELMRDMMTVSDQRLKIDYGGGVRAIERPKEDYVALADAAMAEGRGQMSWVKMSFVYGTALIGLAGGGTTGLITLLLYANIRRRLRAE